MWFRTQYESMTLWHMSCKSEVNDVSSVEKKKKPSSKNIFDIIMYNYIQSQQESEQKQTNKKKKDIFHDRVWHPHWGRYYDIREERFWCGMEIQHQINAITAQWSPWAAACWADVIDSDVVWRYRYLCDIMILMSSVLIISQSDIMAILWH